MEFQKPNALFSAFGAYPLTKIRNKCIKIAYCEECKAEIYIPEIDDFNLKALYDTYRKENNIISLEKIIEIPKLYDIGKRPLSLLLGWGEQTFTRYLAPADIKLYSDMMFNRI